MAILCLEKQLNCSHKRRKSSLWSYYFPFCIKIVFLCPLGFGIVNKAEVCQQILKTQPGPQDWKRSVFIPIPKKGNAKEFSNYCTIALISHTSKVMLKILQARLQQYVNREFHMFKLVLEKAQEPEIKLPTSAGS